MREDWKRDAFERGVAVAVAVPDVADIPAPLSGEWAGESVPELFGLAVGEEWPEEDILADYEEEYWRGVEWFVSGDAD